MRLSFVSDGVGLYRVNGCRCNARRAQPDRIDIILCGVHAQDNVEEVTLLTPATPVEATQ